MIGFKTASTLLATAAVLSLAPISNAEAALVSAAPPTCSISDITNPNAIACSGSWQGNDSNQQNDVLEELDKLFVKVGLTSNGTWTFGGKSDDESGNGPFTSNPDDSTTGTLTFDTVQTGYFAVALKAADNFSLYLLDGGTDGILSFNFNTVNTAVNNNNKAQALSHASLYSFKGSTTPVPTPALLPGLIGMGVAALRKRKGEAEESAEA